MSDSRLGYKPNVIDILSLNTPSISRCSPDGSKVAYSITSTNWTDNKYETHCYVYNSGTGKSHQLTRTGSVTDFQWMSEDTLVVLKTDSNSKAPQVYLYEGLVGDGFKLTDNEKGVQSFKQYREGIIYLANNLEKKNKREKKYGNFTHFEQEESPSALYYTSISHRKEYLKELKGDPDEKPVNPEVMLSSVFPKPLKILSFYPSGNIIYINCKSKDPLVYSLETSSYKLELDIERAESDHFLKKDDPYLGELTKLNLPEGTSISSVSPCGQKLLIRHKERDNRSFTQADYWILSLDTPLEGELVKNLKKITGNLDRSASVYEWIEQGVIIGYSNNTRTSVSLVSESGELSVLNFGGIYPMRTVHVNPSGYISFAGTNAETYPEIYASTEPISRSEVKLRKVSGLGCQIEGWDMGTIETIRWKSKDDTMIEGVLRKPIDFDPNRKYPLAFIVHGGPSAASKEYLMESASRRYPGIQFANSDILVLMPNYRGSVGRGQAFQELNVDNLGVGDLWDVESAIDHLNAKGIIDPAKVVCMGWSQGGYISAMATTHSDKFKAISVGAGISDWYTYHISTDIPHFTTNYLSASPFRNREIYMKTSPMTKIHEAKTPTLIQHGGRDNRVPFSDATELYRGLQEMGVPVELFVYNEMGHGITKPREVKAVLEQNLTWFLYHIYGEELKFPE